MSIRLRDVPKLNMWAEVCQLSTIFFLYNFFSLQTLLGFPFVSHIFLNIGIFYRLLRNLGRKSNIMTNVINIR